MVKMLQTLTGYYSDEQGNWYIRMKRRKPYRFPNIKGQGILPDNGQQVKGALIDIYNDLKVTTCQYRKSRNQSLR